MLLAGQDLGEPIVRQRLQRFQGSQYEILRKKMSLRVQDSCLIFGVVDEEGVLGPDEVYINLPNRSGVLVRDVVVARCVMSFPRSLPLSNSILVLRCITREARRSSIRL